MDQRRAELEQENTDGNLCLDAAQQGLGAGQNSLQAQTESLEQVREKLDKRQADLDHERADWNQQQSAAQKELVAEQSSLQIQRESLDQIRGELDQKRAELEQKRADWHQQQRAAQKELDLQAQRLREIRNENESQREKLGIQAEQHDAELQRLSGEQQSSLEQKELDCISQPNVDPPEEESVENGARAAPQAKPQELEPCQQDDLGDAAPGGASSAQVEPHEDKSQSAPKWSNDEKEKVEQYIAKLLKRDSGDSDSPSQAPDIQAPEIQRTGESDATPTVDADRSDTSAIDSDDTVETAGGMAQTALTSEESSNLLAMREIARQSADLAINEHTQRRLFLIGVGKMVVALAGLTTGIVMLVVLLIGNTYSPNVNILLALVAFAIAFFWGLRGINILRIVRANGKIGE